MEESSAPTSAPTKHVPKHRLDSSKNNPREKTPFWESEAKLRRRLGWNIGSVATLCFIIVTLSLINIYGLTFLGWQPKPIGSIYWSTVAAMSAVTVYMTCRRYLVEQHRRKLGDGLIQRQKAWIVVQAQDIARHVHRILELEAEVEQLHRKLGGEDATSTSGEGTEIVHPPEDPDDEAETVLSDTGEADE